MIDVGKMIASIRKERGLSQAQLAERLSISKQAISNYERGVREPDYVTLEAIADVLNVPMSMLISKEEQAAALEALYADIPLPSNVRPISSLHHQRVPLIGSVAAGEPLYDQEELGVYVEAPVDADAAITIRGDSMEPTYLDGDMVYVKCRPDVPDGAVAVVFLDEDAAIKHVYHEPGGLLLLSDNPAHAPIRATVDDYPNLRIFGVPVGYTRIYKPGISGKIRKGFR